MRRRRGGNHGREASAKTIVIRKAERSSRKATEIVPDIKKAKLREVKLQNVEPGSTVPADEMMATVCWPVAATSSALRS